MKSCVRLYGISLGKMQGMRSCERAISQLVPGGFETDIPLWTTRYVITCTYMMYRLVEAHKVQ